MYLVVQSTEFHRKEKRNENKGFGFLIFPDEMMRKCSSCRLPELCLLQLRVFDDAPIEYLCAHCLIFQMREYRKIIDSQTDKSTSM